MRNSRSVCSFGREFLSSGGARFSSLFLQRRSLLGCWSCFGAFVWVYWIRSCWLKSCFWNFRLKSSFSLCSCLRVGSRLFWQKPFFQTLYYRLYFHCFFPSRVFIWKNLARKCAASWREGTLFWVFLWIYSCFCLLKSTFWFLRCQ